MLAEFGEGLADMLIERPEGVLEMLCFGVHLVAEVLDAAKGFLEVARDVGKRLFDRDVEALDRLPVSPVVARVLDFGPGHKIVEILHLCVQILDLLLHNPHRLGVDRLGGRLDRGAVLVCHLWTGISRA